MKIEIINVGNELLSGKTINTNAAYLCSELLKKGYLVNYTTVLPDDDKELMLGIKQSFKRANLIIVTGGLGPTLDDKTKKIVCDLLKIPMEYREEIALDIEKKFGKIDGINGLSTVPINSFVFKNEVGSAPGFSFLYSGKAVILLPGVPVEMANMFELHGLPFIQKHFPINNKTYQEIINVCLLEEIKVDAVIRACRIPNDITVGIYPNHGVVGISITTTAETKIEAEEKILNVKTQIISQLQDYVFFSDRGLIEEAVHNIFLKKEERLAFAESCSGGALSTKITQFPGSSKYFLGSFVVYSNDLKKNILKVSEKTLHEKGAVSKEVVRKMINGIFKITDATYAIAISGVAGPSGGSDEKPVGTVCLAVAKRGDEIDVGVLHLKGDRSLIVKYASNIAFGILFRKLAHNLLYFEK